MRYYIEHLPMTIPMGVQSENNAEAVEFDVSDWLARDESMSFSVWVTRPGETEAYQAENATLKDGILCWWPTSADTAIAGEGRAEILAVSANRRKLSGWTATSIRETTTETTTEAPVNQRPWLDQALLASEEAKAAATSAAASADQAEGVVKKEIATLTQDIARNTAPPIVPTATGSIVTITDGAARPAVEVISRIEPVQSGSGDTSPDNVRPIKGWDRFSAWRTDKNLWSKNMLARKSSLRPQYGVYMTDNPILPAGTYTYSLYSLSNIVAGLHLAFCNSVNGNYGSIFTDGAPVGGFIYTSDKPVYLAANMPLSDVYSQIGVFEAMLTPGEEHADFTANANEQELTATLPETVYGGKLNWTTGVLENYGHKVTIDGTNVTVSEVGGWGGTLYLVPYLTDYGLPSPAVEGAMACSHFPINKTGADGSSCHVSTDNRGTVYIGGVPGISDAAAYNAWLASNPITVVYRAAAPETIQLTPQQLDTLKGINNVWSDCGDTTLSYIADTKMYIDQKLAAIAAATL